MIKRTILISNEHSLSLRQGQLIFDGKPDQFRGLSSLAIEDIGVLVLENQQIKITHALLQALMENNVAVVSCDARHLPFGLMLPMFQHHAFTEKLMSQIEASLPLRKQLWQQTVVAKIRNQARLLELRGLDGAALRHLATQVRSGDSGNIEGRAAAIYWRQLMGVEAFVRDREGDMPNPMFNYAYAILLAVVARALVSSGLHTSIGIHHRNKYNPWCLASDIMEPYRPVVDKLVLGVAARYPEAEKLDTNIKKELLQVPVLDVLMDGQKSPLMVAAQRSTASLAACFEGSARKILYPELVN